MKLLGLLLGILFLLPIHSQAENRMKKNAFHDTKKKLMDESLGANVSYYKTYGKELGQYYKRKGQQIPSSAAVKEVSAGSYHVSAPSNAPVIILNENYGNVNNIAIHDSIGSTGK